MPQAAVVQKEDAVCNTCTRRLVDIAYERSQWFCLVREPLKFVMRSWARLHAIDPGEYEVRSPSCYSCTRFYKTALKERSGLFRLLNSLVNPIFDAILKQIVSEAEVNKAKAHAQAAMAGETLSCNGDKYVTDFKWWKI